MSKLTAKQIEHAAPTDREYRLSDGNGIFLRVRTSGAKSWLYCFRLPGNRTLLQMTLGTLQDVSLKEVRSKLPNLRKQVAQGIDPRTARAVYADEQKAAWLAWGEMVKQHIAKDPNNIVLIKKMVNQDFG